MSPVNLEDYIPVAERVSAFYLKFPDGSLQSEMVELSESRVVMRAYAYRTPDDVKPGIGYSSMPIPATNVMLRNSEIEVAETSAWGRAIAALGFEVKRGIASAEEVANKQDHPVAKAEPEHAVKDGPWSEGSLTTKGAIFLKNSAPGLDGELRHTADGPRLMFGLDLGDNKRIPQVVALGELAVDIHDAIGNVGQHLNGMQAEVSGELFRVPWAKDGKARPPFQRLVLAWIKTPEWRLPVPEEVDIMLPEEVHPGGR